MVSKSSAKTKTSDANAFRNIIPVCIFVSVLTAILVTLIFSLGFTNGIKELTESRNSEYNGYFASKVSANERDASGIVLLDNKAVIDMALSGKTGFLYVSTADCAECSMFETRLASIKNDSEIENIYHFVLDKDSNGGGDTYYAQAVTVGTDSIPALLYFRDGMIYDRLDDARDVSNLSTFIAKYK